MKFFITTDDNNNMYYRGRSINDFNDDLDDATIMWINKNIQYLNIYCINLEDKTEEKFIFDIACLNNDEQNNIAELLSYIKDRYFNDDYRFYYERISCKKLCQFKDQIIKKLDYNIKDWMLI